jgi:hypothetical protein
MTLPVGAYVRCVQEHRKDHSGRIIRVGDVGKVTGGGTMVAVDGTTWPEECWTEISYDEWKEARFAQIGRRDFYDPPLVVETPDGDVPLVGYVMP